MLLRADQPGHRPSRLSDGDLFFPNDAFQHLLEEFAS
jgi:hypothetical protein